MRTGNYHVFSAKAVICGAGGASQHLQAALGRRRHAAAPGMRRGAARPPTGCLIHAGAKMTQMENRIVLTRFKDGYGPVGAYFLHLKTYTQNAYGRGVRIEVVPRRCRKWSARSISIRKLRT